MTGPKSVFPGDFLVLLSGLLGMPPVDGVEQHDLESRGSRAQITNQEIKIGQNSIINHPGGGHAAELQRNPEAHSGACDTCDTCGTHTGAHRSTCTFDIGVNHVSACKLGDVESRCFVKRIF